MVSKDGRVLPALRSFARIAKACMSAWRVMMSLRMPISALVKTPRRMTKPRCQKLSASLSNCLGPIEDFFGAMEKRPIAAFYQGGARGRTRTGMAFRPGDFLPTSAFAAPNRVRGLEHAFTVAFRP